MAGPFTAFTYGDPSLNGFKATLNIELFTGFTLTGGNASPVPVAVVLQSGIVGTAYSETISAQGGSSPYTFSIISGTLPSGLTLTGSTGVISGTPTTPGTFTFNIQVADSRSVTGTEVFVIMISAPSVSVSNYGFIS